MSETQRKAPPKADETAPIKALQSVSSLFTNRQFVARLEKAIPQTMTPQRMLGTLAASIRKNPMLMQCDVLDMAGKMLFLAAAGLEPDTALQQAHLIPFRNSRWVNRVKQEYVECQVVIGYRGLIDLSWRSGRLRSIYADVVWMDEVRAGKFRHQRGTHRELYHEKLGNLHNYSPEAQAAATAEYPIWAFVEAEVEGGGVPFHVMSWNEIEAIRNNSPAYRSALHWLHEANEKNQKLPASWTKAPWIAFLPAMAQKTVIRQSTDFLPRSIEMANVLAVDAAGDRGTVDLSPIVDLDPSQYVDAAADALGNGEDASTTFGDRRPSEGTEQQQRPSQGTAQGAGQRQVTRSSGQPGTRARTAPAAPADNAGPSAGHPAASDDDPGPVHPQQTQQREPRADLKPQPSAPKFEAYLVDHDGEIVDGPFADPIAWTEALTKLIEECFPADRQAILDQNQHVADSLAVHPQCGPALAALAELDDEDQAGQQETQTSPAPEEQAQAQAYHAVERPKEERGRVPWKGYLDEFDKIAHGLPAEHIDGWVTAQLPVALTAPMPQQMRMRATIVSQCEELGVMVPASVGRLAHAPEQANSDLFSQMPKFPAEWQKEIDNVKARLSNVAAFQTKEKALEHIRSPAVTLLFNRLIREGKQELADYLIEQANRIAEAK